MRGEFVRRDQGPSPILRFVLRPDCPGLLEVDGGLSTMILLFRGPVLVLHAPQNLLAANASLHAKVFDATAQSRTVRRSK